MRSVTTYSLTILVGFTLALDAPLRTAAQQSTNPSSFADLVRSEPREIQQQKITKLAEAGMVLGEESLPEAFDLLLSGKALNTYMDAFDEPLSNARLDALERLLVSDKDQDAKVRAAAILYRHGRDAGGDFLKALMENHDVRAALIFSLNRVQEMAPLIAETIIITPGRADELLTEATAILSEDQAHMVLTAIEKRNWDTPRAIALPLLATSEELATLKSEFAKYADENSLKLDFAAALSRLGDEDGIVFLQSQLRRVSTQQQPAKRALLFRAVSLSGNDVFVEELRQVLLRSATSITGLEYQDLRKREDNIIGAIGALRALGASLEDEHIATTFAAFKGSKDPRLMMAFMLSGSEFAATLVQARVGMDEYERIQTILELKPLPDEYLPRESKRWTWWKHGLP